MWNSSTFIEKFIIGSKKEKIQNVDREMRISAISCDRKILKIQEEKKKLLEKWQNISKTAKTTERLQKISKQYDLMNKEIQILQQEKLMLEGVERTVKEVDGTERINNKLELASKVLASRGISTKSISKFDKTTDKLDKINSNIQQYNNETTKYFVNNISEELENTINNFVIANEQQNNTSQYDSMVINQFEEDLKTYNLQKSPEVPVNINTDNNIEITQNNNIYNEKI